MTGPKIDAFFKSEGIEVFSEVFMEDIPAPDHEYVQEFFPKAGSVIVFAKEIPAFIYNQPPKEKTRNMLEIAESLDKSAKKLAALLNSQGTAALPVPLYLPVTITDGKVRGVVRLKQIAAGGGLGETGKSTLLLTPEFGPRVFLSGVVTARYNPKSGNKKNSVENISDTETPAVPLCTGCGLCIKKCPEKVFGPEGLDTFRCRTIRPWVHPVFVPAVKWLLKRRMLLKFMAPFAPVFARFATMPCSGCVTECPRF